MKWNDCYAGYAENQKTERRIGEWGLERYCKDAFILGLLSVLCGFLL